MPAASRPRQESTLEVQTRIRYSHIYQHTKTPVSTPRRLPAARLNFSNSVQLDLFEIVILSIAKNPRIFLAAPRSTSLTKMI